MNLEPRNRERLSGWTLVFLVPLFIVAFHWRAALPGMAFSGSDLRYFFFAIREAVAGAITSGHLPWWQRGIFMGYPLVADPQAAVLDFATWLTLPWNAPRALTLATLLHLTVAGWGMALWMRLRGLSTVEALLAAVLFALGAKETVHVIHWNFAASTAWWPWMLAGLEGFARSEWEGTGEAKRSSPAKGRWLLLTASTTAGSWFGGSPQMAYFGTLMAGLYALVLAPQLWRRRKLDALLALASVSLGLALAAPLILPVSELSQLGPRGGGVSYAFATSWKWIDRWALALLLLPSAYGGRHLFGEMNLWEATGYLGILPLGLAAAAPLLRRRGLWLFALLGVIGVWVGFGEDSWLGLHYFLYRFLPGYGSFRCPTRMLMVTSFASALLAAEGLHALRARSGWEGRWGRAVATLLLAGALAMVLPHLPGFDLDGQAARKAAWAALGFAVLGSCWLAAGARFGRGATWAAAALALFVTDSYYVFGTMNEVAAAEGERPSLSEFAPLMQGTGNRVGIAAAWGKSANAPLRQRWEGVAGYGPMCIQRVRVLIEATQDNRVQASAPITTDTNFPRPRFESPLWRLFAAPVVISDRPQALPRLATGEAEWSHPLIAYRAAALPRVYWTGSWTVADDSAVTLPLLEATRGDRAVLPAPLPGFDSGPPEGPVAAEAMRVGDDWMEAMIVAPRDGLVVVLDPYYPGWSASLDGLTTPLLRANFAFQAIPVKAGRHRLRLEYHNHLVEIGGVVSVGALAFLLGLLIWRRRPPPPDPE